MMHLTTEQLEKYGRNSCSPEELILVIQHLDICSACFSNFQVLYPKQTDPDNPVEILDLLGDAESFHLDYEAHLQPFVDNELNEIDLEIVQTHLQVCSSCAFELRNLREFSESLQLQKFQRKQTAAAPTFLSTLNQASLLQLSAVAILCLIFALSILLFYSNDSTQKPDQTSNSLILNQAATTDTSAEVSQSTNVKLQSNRREDDSVRQASAEKKVYVRRKINLEHHQKIIDKETHLTKQLDFSESEEFNLLPQNWQNLISEVLQSRKLNIPAIVKSWDKNSIQRSISDEKSFLLSPNKEAVKDQSPTFTWQDLSRTNKTYTVQIFDENFTLITESPQLNQPQWKPNIALARGGIYRWQVNGILTGSDNGITQTKLANGNFIVLSLDQEKELDQMEKIMPAQHLIRGILYAEKGLLKDSQNEFRKHLKQNPNSEIIKSFLKQIK